MWRRVVEMRSNSPFVKIGRGIEALSSKEPISFSVMRGSAGRRSIQSFSYVAAPCLPPRMPAGAAYTASIGLQITVPIFERHE
jgi:hypothetical protein